MEALQKNLGAIGGAILALLNALASIGVVLPQGADAEGVALVNAAVIAVGLAVAHFVKPKAPAEPPAA